MIDINKVEEQAKLEIAQKSINKAKKAIKEELRAIKEELRALELARSVVRNIELEDLKLNIGNGSYTG